MNTKSRTEKGEDSITREIRACIVCGATFSATSEFCPVCMLRRRSLGELSPGNPSLRMISYQFRVIQRNDLGITS